MNTVRLWPRIVGVVVATLVGVFYIGHVILGYNPFGAHGFEIRVQVPDAAGVYKDGSVTYHGVPVGHVDRLEIKPDTVDLVLRIDAGEKIPADSAAHVRMLSALGEQYVDLVPSSPSATASYLRAGDVIPESRTTVPVPVGQALNSGKQFLDAIDPKDLQTVENFLATAFSDVAPELKRLVVTGQDLTNALIKGQAGTRKLILDGRTVLKAGNASSGDLKSYVAALDKLSRRFADSDDDIATLLSSGGGALSDIEDLVSTMSGPWKDLMKGAGAAGQAVAENTAAVRALFGLLPSVTGKLAGVPKGGQLRGVLTLNDGQPLCAYRHALPVPGTTAPGGSPMHCPSRSGLQMRGPVHAPGGAK